MRGARPNYVSQGNYHHLFAFAFPYPTAVSGVELTAPSAEVFKIPAEVSLFGETSEGEEVMLHDSFAHHLFTAGKGAVAGGGADSASSSADVCVKCVCVRRVSRR